MPRGGLHNEISIFDTEMLRLVLIVSKELTSIMHIDEYHQRKI